MREGWKEVEIKSFAEIVGGGTPSTKIEEYWNGEIPWITPNDLSNHTFKYIERGERNISDLGLSKSSAKLHPINTILLTSRAPIGYLALAKNEVSTNQGFQSIRCDENKANANYVYYALKVYMDRVKALASGATFPEVSGKKVGKVKLPLPPLETQKKIASILSGYDDLIENNLKRIKILEEMAQQTYEEWFVRMRFPGHESATMNPETGLPEGWEKKNLGEITESMQYGYTESAIFENIGPKFLRITDIVGSNIIWENVPHCTIEEKQKPKYTLKEGDIVIARTGATVGFAKRINKNCPDSVFASYLIRLKLKKEIDDVFVGVFVESPSFVQIVKNMAGGAAQPNANAPILKQIEIIVPTKEIQESFRKIVLVYKDSQQILLDQNQRLREARDILLPRLMMGMIEV